MGFAFDYKKYWDTGPLTFLKMCKCASTSIRETTGAEHMESPDTNKPMFTVVRNPYTRLVSAWAHRVNGGEVPFHNSFMYDWDYWETRIWRGMPFDAFVDLVAELPDEKCECHFCPTSHIANQCLKSGSMWLKVEELSTEWPPFAAKYGFRPTLLRKVKSKHSPCQELYTDKIQEKVYQRYIADFKRWDYGRGLPE